MQLGCSYLGFTDNLSPMRRKRVENILDTREYGFVTRKDEIFQALLRGDKLEYQDCVKYWSDRNSDYREASEYRLYTGKHEYYVITKTEYDFGCYLIEQGLLDEEAAQRLIDAEQARLRQSEIERLAEEAKALEAAQAEKEAQVAYEDWRREQAEAYANQDRLELLQSIYLHMLGSNRYPIDLLVEIENIDNPRCRNSLIGRLHTGNAASRRVFECVTGLKLPGTNRSTVEFLSAVTASDYKESKPYKPRKKPQAAVLEPFFYCTKSGSFTEVLAQPLTKYGFALFIQKTETDYRIFEALSGVFMASGNTKQEALSSLKKSLEQLDSIKRFVQETIEQNGISPRYKGVDDKKAS